MTVRETTLSEFFMELKIAPEIDDPNVREAAEKHRNGERQHHVDQPRVAKEIRRRQAMATMIIAVAILAAVDAERGVIHVRAWGGLPHQRVLHADVDSNSTELVKPAPRVTRPKSSGFSNRTRISVLSSPRFRDAMRRPRPTRCLWRRAADNGGVAGASVSIQAARQLGARRD